MNRFLVRNATLIPRRSKTWLTRQERIKKEGSDYYSWNTPVTAPGAITTIEIAHQFPEARKYQPLDWIEVHNTDVVDVSLIINVGTVLPVSASSLRTVDNHALWQVGIRNDHATISTTLNKIKVSLRRQPMTIDEWARRGA